jgi:phosphinothricin acetyltransferase
MPSAPTIRRAHPDDAPAIAAIYDEGIASGVATFARGPHDPAERRAWLAARPERAPVYVGEMDRTAIAWSALAPLSHRTWYDGVAEYTVYVAGSARGRGVGAAMLAHLVGAAPGHGYYKLVGHILAGNTAGLRLAEDAGFRVVGTHRAHGRVGGEWRDVTVVERHLEEPGP